MKTSLPSLKQKVVFSSLRHSPFLTAVLCLLSVQTVAAQYRFDSWTTDNGLPQVSVNAILQTRDGFLWMTTFGGLVRYDGLRFEVFNTGNTRGLKTSRLLRMLEDRDGNLWITAEGQGLVRYRDGLFTTYTTADGLSDDNVTRLESDAEGNLLLSAGGVWLRWTDEGFASYAPIAAAVGEPTTGVLHRTQTGAVWDAQGDRLRRTERGRATVDQKLGLFVLRLYEDRQGRAWIAAEKSDELFMLEGGKLTTVRVGDRLPQHRFGAAYEDRQGRVWFGTPSGLLLFEDGRLRRYTVADGLVRGAVTAIYQDREGTIWVGTSGGLSRLSEKVVNAYSVSDGLAAENVYTVYEDRRGRVWIGSWNGLSVYEDGRFRDVGARYGVERDLVSSLLEDAEGSLWIGTWGGKIVRVRGGRVEVVVPSLGPPLRAIYQDRAGVVWIGTASGLASFKEGTFTPPKGREVFTIYEDRQRRLWLGTQDGLVRYEDGAFTNLAGSDAPFGIVRSIHEDRDGALWVGTYDSGLYRLKHGRFTRYTTKEGLFDNGAFQILEDHAGNFWMSCNLGVYRVRKSELDDLAEGRAQKVVSVPYNKRDGMLNSECNGGTQPAGMRARDGRLWFPTQEGVAVINPVEVPFNSQPPPVVISSIVVNAEKRDARSNVTVGPGQTYVEIHYSGLSFINPELVRFKYRLAGLDGDWIDSGTRRAAYYSHLPPGEYRFTVLAANRDGVWNEQGASVAITVLPPFWRTWWFVGLASLTVAALVLFIYRRRVGQLQRAAAARETFARKLIESQENERRRIAAELHDSLGQSLVLIKNWALLGLRANGGTEPVGANLDEISETASAAIKEVREIAYNLGPYQLERLGLAHTIREMVERVARSSPIRFRVEIDPLDGLFSRQAEISIYRLAQEAVNNVVKHSEATAASLSIRVDGGLVTLTISDDGRGFTPAASADDGDGERPLRGFGLLGLQERVRLLKGEMKIESEPGRGTRINITIPREREENGR